MTEPLPPAELCFETDHNMVALHKHRLYQWAIDNGYKLYRGIFSDREPKIKVNSRKKRLDLVEDIKNQLLEAKLVEQEHTPEIVFYEMEEASDEYVITWNFGAFDKAILVLNRSNTALWLDVISTSEEFVNKIQTVYKANTVLKGSTNELFLYGKGRQGYELESLGKLEEKLIIENYADELHDKINYCIEQLDSKDPDGRLIILNGEPGTGKTRLVKAICSKLQKCKCIYIPSNLLDALTGPDMAAALIELKTGTDSENSWEDMAYNKRFPLLIIEDADALLTSRAADNMSRVSELLNQTDGLIGQAINIRVITTTNAKKIDIDPALQRNGRIGAMLNVDALGPDEVVRVAERLGVADKLKQPVPHMLLADIYALSRDKKQEKFVKKSRGAGFV